MPFQPQIQSTYRSIRFRPEQFNEYLLKDVGFKSCELLGTPQNTSKGKRLKVESSLLLSNVYISFFRISTANIPVQKACCTLEECYRCRRFSSISICN